MPFFKGTGGFPVTGNPVGSRTEIQYSMSYYHQKTLLFHVLCVNSTLLVSFILFLQFARTEMIKDTLNPDFVKKVVMQYFFEQSQKLKFEM